MNVEIGTEAAQFPEKEYINRFSLQCTGWSQIQRQLKVCASLLYLFFPKLSVGAETISREKWNVLWRKERMIKQQ